MTSAAPTPATSRRGPPTLDLVLLQRENDAFAAEKVAAGPASAANTVTQAVPSGDPLSSLQWDMDVIDAPAAHATQSGDDRVLVGIIDTGLDASHPDIAPNFNADLSRNFTLDIPLIDGACNEEPDGRCTDPADVDEGGHGTHVGSTVAAPRNGIGIVGVAPTSSSSTCEPVRTPATSSCSPPSMHSPMPQTTASTWST